nr:neutral zinc metallopeptidase [Cyclobacteriaceae bacterium]
MKWQGRRQSGNVDDQRGRSGRRPLGGIGLGKGGLGILVIVLIISWLTGT